MHGTRPARHPVDGLRRRGGVIGQRLLAAALPALADLPIAPVAVRTDRVALRRSRPARRSGSLPYLGVR